MKPNIDWVALEGIRGGPKILDARRLALAALDPGKASIAEIAKQSDVPASSLSSIKCHGPYAHRLPSGEESGR
jgi:hypothetical protein